MIKLTVLLVLTFSSLFLFAQEPNTTHALQITVNNLENIKGKLQVCLTAVSYTHLRAHET